MFNNKKISIVIPCFNEEEGLINIFKKLPNFIDEVIVVDNGSTDNTAQIAKDYGVHIIYVPDRGYGRAYQKGLSYANGDIIITMDGDNSYPVSAIKDMLIYMEENGYDFISGCRFPLKYNDSMHFVNKAANLIISWLIRRLFKVNIIDSQSGMGFFKKDILQKIISFNPGMGFSQEIKINAWLRPDIRCAEFHIPYQKRAGQVKFRKVIDSLKNLYEILILLKKNKK